MPVLNAEQHETLVDAAYSVDVELRSYSGRYMSGRRCLGIATRDFGDVLRLIVEIASMDLGLAEEMSCCACYDQLGTGLIHYFPMIEWSDALEEAFSNVYLDEEDS